MSVNCVLRQNHMKTFLSFINVFLCGGKKASSCVCRNRMKAEIHWRLFIHLVFTSTSSGSSTAFTEFSSFNTHTDSFLHIYCCEGRSEAWCFYINLSSCVSEIFPEYMKLNEGQCYLINWLINVQRVFI